MTPRPTAWPRRPGLLSPRTGGGARPATPATRRGTPRPRGQGEVHGPKRSGIVVYPDAGVRVGAVGRDRLGVRQRARAGGAPGGEAGRGLHLQRRADRPPRRRPPGPRADGRPPERAGPGRRPDRRHRRAVELVGGAGLDRPADSRGPRRFGRRRLLETCIVLEQMGRIPLPGALLLLGRAGHPGRPGPRGRRPAGRPWPPASGGARSPSARWVTATRWGPCAPGPGARAPTGW